MIFLSSHFGHGQYNINPKGLDHLGWGVETRIKAVEDQRSWKADRRG